MNKKNDFVSPFDMEDNRMMSFPMYKKVQTVLDNGDIKEDFQEMSPDEMRDSISASVFSDALNGTQMADVEHLDKFQLMDALEKSIDSLPQDYFDRLKEKLQ